MALARPALGGGGSVGGAGGPSVGSGLVGRGVRVGGGGSVGAGVRVMGTEVGGAFVGRMVACFVGSRVGVCFGSGVSSSVAAGVGGGTRVVGRITIVGDGVGVLVRRASATRTGAPFSLGSTKRAASDILGISTPIPVEADDAMTALVRMATSSRGSSGAGANRRYSPIAPMASAMEVKRTRRQPDM